MRIVLTILDVNGEFLIALDMFHLLVSIMDWYKKRPPKYYSSTGRQQTTGEISLRNPQGAPTNFVISGRRRPSYLLRRSPQDPHVKIRQLP